MEQYITGYNVTATIEKYNETAGNEDKKDLIKILTVKVQYKINDRQETNEVKRLITKDNIEIQQHDTI